MEGSDIQQQLQLLKDVQEIDSQAHKARADRKELEKELNELESESGRIRGMVADLEESLAALQAQRKELGQALEQERENVAKAESRLPAIKTQKEYVAVLKEVDTAKKLNRELEERIQQKEAEIAEVEQEKQEKDQTLSEQEEKVSGRKSEIEGRLSEIDEVLASRDDERNSLLDQVPAPLRKRYQMLLDRRGGLAIVEARQGACLGCNMQLPPQVFNNLFRNEEVLTCPHCNRMIYLAAEAQGQ